MRDDLKDVDFYKILRDATLSPTTLDVVRRGIGSAYGYLPAGEDFAGLHYLFHSLADGVIEEMGIDFDPLDKFKDGE